MAIDDYRKANCTLFRHPPVDFSGVDDAIEQILVDAWKNGYSVGTAMQRVLKDSSVVGSLQSQVEKNMAFQRDIAEKKVNAKRFVEAQGYENDKRRQLMHIDETLGKESEEKAEAVRAKDVHLESKTQVYSAAQARLEEVRARVKAKISQIGGKAGYEALMEIREMMDDNSEDDYDGESEDDKSQKKDYKPRKKRKRKKSKDSKKDKEPDLERALELATCDEEVDPLKEPEPKEEHGKVYRAGRAVWGAMNYDLAVPVTKVLTYDLMIPVKKILFYKLW